MNRERALCEDTDSHFTTRSSLQTDFYFIYFLFFVKGILSESSKKPPADLLGRSHLILWLVLPVLILFTFQCHFFNLHMFRNTVSDYN